MSQGHMTRRKEFKIVLLGDKNVGKTSLLRRYITGQFQDADKHLELTIGATFELKQFSILNQGYQMEIWDTTGEEKYQSISKHYYRNAVAAIVCYDTMDEISYENLTYWMNEMRLIESHCKFYICSTKCDLLDEYQRKQATSITENYSREYRAKCFLTSSKTGENIDDLFMEIIQDNVALAKDVGDTTDSVILETTDEVQQKKKSKKCCFK